MQYSDRKIAKPCHQRSLSARSGDQEKSRPGRELAAHHHHHYHHLLLQLLNLQLYSPRAITRAGFRLESSSASFVLANINISF